MAAVLAVSRDCVSVCTIWMVDEDEEEDLPCRGVGLLRSNDPAMDYAIPPHDKDVFFLSHNNGYGLVDLGLYNPLHDHKTDERLLH